MAVTYNRFQEWIKEGKDQGAMYLISVCDTFDYDDYPVYANSEEEMLEKKEHYNNASMQRVNEVVDLTKV
jgi:hypothetical protein